MGDDKGKVRARIRDKYLKHKIERQGTFQQNSAFSANVSGHTTPLGTPTLGNAHQKSSFRVNKVKGIRPSSNFVAPGNNSVIR
jgi:hypothetical protein